MNRLDSKCTLDVILSSFLSGWNLNGLFQCTSENVAIWLMKQMTGFGFHSRRRVGIKLNLTFGEGRENVSHPATEPAALGRPMFCTLLPSGAPASQHAERGDQSLSGFPQTRWAEDTFTIVIFKLKLLFCKTLGKRYFAYNNLEKSRFSRVRSRALGIVRPGNHRDPQGASLLPSSSSLVYKNCVCCF